MPVTNRVLWSATMKAYLLLTLVLAQLLWWDLIDKVLIMYRWSAARALIDATLSWRGRRLFAIARFTVGIRLRVEIDQETLPDQMILIANHQSVIDIIALLASFRNHSLRFVAKRELGRWFPAVSRVLRVQRHALISRHGDFGTAMREIEHLGRGLARPEGSDLSVCPVIFPEGTRSRDGVVRRFHSGAVRRLQRERPLPIVAIALDGGWRFARMQDLAKIPVGHEYRVSVVAIYPYTRSKTEMIAQIDDAQARVTETIARWRSDIHAR